MRILKSGFALFMFLHMPWALADISVFACEPEWAALAKEIGADTVSVHSATTGRQDPHHIEARPSLIAKARRADLLFCTGAELEQGWLPVLLRKAGNPAILPGRPGHLMASDHVSLLDKPQTLDRSHGDVHASGNPHIHLNPHNILQVARVLAQRLGEINESERAFYKTSLHGFEERWTGAITGWEAQALDLRNKAFAVNHKSWLYLASWLQLDMTTTLEPQPGVPPNAEHLSQLIDIVQKKKIKKIIYSAHSNPRAAHWLADKTGIRAIELPYTVGGSEKVDNLYQLFDETLRLLKE